MLPATHRMRRAHDFEAAVRGGRRAGRPTLVVHSTALVHSTVDEHVDNSGSRDHSVPDSPRDNDGDAGTGGPVVPALVGFVVSKAVGNAVTRNRVKRRLRALMREQVAALPAGTRVVVRANPGAARATFEGLGDDLDGALRTLRRRSGVSSAR
jgi:ribonuclease P protein component